MSRLIWVAWFSWTADYEFSLVIDRRDCGCYSHNGFLTRRGYEMVAASKHEGLTGPPKGVRVDESVSVSAPETEAERASRSDEGLSSAEVPPELELNRQL